MRHAELRKSIGFIAATSLVIGTVIGSGIFMKPGVVIAAAGDSTMALWAWIIGGIITLASGLTIAEVSVKIPKTGGLYVYVEKVYGKFWGFLCGWVQTIIYGPAVIGALGLYFGSLFAGVFGFSKQTETWIGILAVLFLALINMLGTQYGGAAQSLLTLAKLLPIFLIIVFGMFQGDVPVFGMKSESSQAISMGAAVLATLWAYDGWMNVGFVAGEMKNPAKTLPKAIITGIVIVMLCYLAVNIALLHVLPASKIVELGPNAAKESRGATIWRCRRKNGCDRYFNFYFRLFEWKNFNIPTHAVCDGRRQAVPWRPFLLARSSDVSHSCSSNRLTSSDRCGDDANDQPRSLDRYRHF